MPTKSSVACEGAVAGRGLAGSLAGGCLVAALLFVAAVVPAEAGASIVRVEPYSDRPASTRSARVVATRPVALTWWR